MIENSDYECGYEDGFSDGDTVGSVTVLEWLKRKIKRTKGITLSDVLLIIDEELKGE